MSIVSAEPLPADIAELLKKNNVPSFALMFEGGNDEGYLDVDMMYFEGNRDELTRMIEDWAWNAYSYNGAGDGNRYGTHIVYDLVNGKVTINDWYMERQEDPEEVTPLEISPTESSEEKE